MAAWTLAFDDPDLVLDVGGGKGTNLGRLARAGFPVPAGFVVSTAAYRATVAEHGLSEVIAEATGRLRPGSPDDTADAQAASALIRTAFASLSVAHPTLSGAALSSGAESLP